MATISSEIEKKYDIYVKEQTGKLIQDLNSARKERRLCDCLIKVGSEEIPAHRIILSEGCDYYRGMFTHEMRESQSGVVEMKGVDPECMVICIEYIYTGKITVRESKIHPLLQIAQMLQLTGLFDALVAFLVQHLDAESFFVTRDLANNFGLTELQKKCEQYGEQNFEAISQQEGFQHIDKRSIISLVTSEGNKTPEGIKLKSIFDWIKYEPKERKKTLRELHKYIDLPKVPVEYRRNLIEDEPLVHSCSELMRRISISVMDTANIQSCDVGAVGGTAVLQPNVTDYHCPETSMSLIPPTSEEPTSFDIADVDQLLEHVKKIQLRVRDEASAAKTSQSTKDSVEDSDDGSGAGMQTPQEQLYISVKLPNSHVTVQVWKTNIIDHKCDVIVNASSPQLQLYSAGVSGVIKDLDIRNGGVIQNAMKQLIQNNRGDFQSGDAVITTAGNLKNCKGIVHAVGPRWNSAFEKNPDGALKACIFKSLEETDRVGLTSIAIPAISCGIFGGKVNVCIPLISEAVVEYFKEHKTTSIKRVDFVEKQKQDVLVAFKRSVQTYQDPDSETRDQQQSYDAWETRKMVHCQVVQDEVFGRLSDWELWELKEVAIANKVKIADKPNRYLNQLAVEGFMQDVMKAHKAVKDIVKEFCEAETAASFVTWQKLVRGAWEDFHPRSAYILEKAYKARNGNNRDPKLNKIKVPEYRNHQLYQTIVDLTKLGDHYGPNPPNVRRRVKEKGSDEVIPSFWAPMQNQPFLKVALNFGSSEYQTACSYYRKMGGSGNIVKIERIQNVALYKQFIAQKAAVAKKMQSKNPVERQLFYGTDDDKIAVNGFDRSYAGKNATIHGVGVYFALQASYAIGHARPNSQGHRRMFLADVITGDYCQGHRAYKAAPPKPSGIANDVYDSVVNNMSAPGVWVIFKNANAYPKFLITFA